MKKSLTILILLFMTMNLLEAKSIDEMRGSKKFWKVKGKYQEKINGDNYKKYPAKEMEVILNLSKKLWGFFKKHPLIQECIGFNAYGILYVKHPDEMMFYKTKSGIPISVTSWLNIRDFGMGENGKAHESINSSSDIIFRINDIDRIFLSHSIYTSGYGKDIYFQPKKMGEFKGYPIYNENEPVILLTRSKKPLWIPVSAEEFIKISIKRAKDQRDKDAAEIKGEKSPKEIYDSGKAERKKSFDEAYAILKQHNPAEAERAKKEFLESEKRFAQEASVHDEKKQREMGNELITKMNDHIKALENELAKLSPSQKKAQAFYVGEREDSPSGLGSASDENAKPVVRKNKDYFNDGLSINAIRCVAIIFSLQGGVLGLESFDSDQEELSLQDLVAENIIKTLSWNELFDLLK